MPMCPFTTHMLYRGRMSFAWNLFFIENYLCKYERRKSINERKRVQQGEERPRKGLLKEREQGGGKDGAHECLLRAFPY